MNCEIIKHLFKDIWRHLQDLRLTVETVYWNRILQKQAQASKTNHMQSNRINKKAYANITHIVQVIHGFCSSVIRMVRHMH